MTRDEEIVQKALDEALKAIRDRVADPRNRAMIYAKVEEAKLIHKGTMR